YRSKARPFRLRSHWLWSLESVSLRPRFSPYDFGCVITLGRFSQITCALLALKALAVVIDNDRTGGS
ncbi:hypothetical protein, partial [Yersinia intermedia]|uniref:hypothetical protein n=1 Tax=Yersinia intermedia TaxID=631 RepID=UPI001C1031A5